MDKIDALQLYTGMMHKNCRKLRDAVCTRAVKVELADHGVFVGDFGGQQLNGEDADVFAQQDGFIDYEAMVLFFKKLYPKKEWPITLYLTEWGPLT